MRQEATYQPPVVFNRWLGNCSQWIACELAILASPPCETFDRLQMRGYSSRGPAIFPKILSVLVYLVGCDVPERIEAKLLNCDSGVVNVALLTLGCHRGAVIVKMELERQSGNLRSKDARRPLLSCFQWTVNIA